MRDILPEGGNMFKRRREIERIEAMRQVFNHSRAEDISKVFELGRKKFWLQHIINPHTPPALLHNNILREHPDVIVFGHTHKPFNQTISDIWYFNPGYAGKPRFSLERSVALLHFERSKIRPEFLKL